LLLVVRNLFGGFSRHDPTGEWRRFIIAISIAEGCGDSKDARIIEALVKT
jgi:hypothetical protein